MTDHIPTFQGFGLHQGDSQFVIRWLRKGRASRNWSAARRRRVRRAAR